jgi:hypothetical protein
VVARAHVHALEVASEDLLEVIPTIDDISCQIIQPGPSKICYVDWEELDDEKIIIHSAHSACDMVLLQPGAEIGFAILLDDVARRSKMPWEMSVMHGTSKCL